ncbi:MAG: class I SAM-dependent methyltransferase [Planctomycetes bacterium]|nr:class I SAM-dependent methyltransferase [Planctomycetota bacterium]
MTAFERYMHTPAGKAFADKYLNLVPREEIPCILCGHNRSWLWYRMGAFESRICRECGCRYVSPRYDDQQLDEHYAESLFTKARDYEGVLHNMLDEKERARKRNDMKFEIEETLNSCSGGGRVLDIGCQTGIYLEALPGNLKKYGVERSHWAAEEARKRCQAEILSDKIEDCDFEPGSFDIINISYVLEHIQAPKPMIKSIAKWLKPNGKMIVSVPNFGSICAIIFREFYRLAEPRQHIFLTTKRAVKDVMAAAGLRTEKVHYPYFGTPYCRPREIIRFFTNSSRRLLLPILLRAGITPAPAKLVSPPFYGNIMTVVAVKEEIND